MQINTKSIKRRFEKSMDKYDKNAVVQVDCAKKIIDNLASLKSEFATILELGAGTGVLTKIACKKLRFGEYIANDLTEKSKKYLEKILPDVKFIQGNAAKIKPYKKADIVLSNAMFQWFAEIQDITDICAGFLNSGGILAFSTFGTKNFEEINDLSGLTLNYNTKDEIIDKLKAKYEILYIEDFISVLEFSTPLELLLHMKNTGVNSLSAKPWTVKDVKCFCENYLKKFDKVRLTYNPIIVIAKLK